MESAKREKESREKAVAIMKNFDRIELKQREGYERQIRDLQY